MVNEDTEICVCNGLTVGDIAKCIKENNLDTLEALLENEMTSAALLKIDFAFRISSERNLFDTFFDIYERLSNG